MHVFAMGSRYTADEERREITHSVRRGKERSVDFAAATMRKAKACSFASITRVAAVDARTCEQLLNGQNAIGKHRCTGLLARCVAHAPLRAIDERHALGARDTRFELRFACLRQTQIARFYLVRARTRKRTKRPGTTRHNRKLRKTHRVCRVTPVRAARIHRRTSLYASNEAKTFRLVRAFAIR